MKKIFGFLAPRRSSTNSHGNNGSRTPETEDGITSDGKYIVRDEDLRKLHRAAYMGNAQQVQQLLLDRPYHANLRDKKNRTALHLACAAGHLRVVNVLVNQGCDLNLCDLGNRTALMKAIQCRKQECAALLLECGANPHIQDTAGNTALHYAVFSENTVMAEKLLEYKADIEAKNKCGLTPLLLAMKTCNHQMVEFLINKNANVHAVDNMKRTALMLAAKNDSSNTVRLLLEHGVDVFSRDWREQTAEDYAHLMGCDNNVQLISHYKEERRTKESSETSNLGSPEIHPHLEPIVEVEDPGPPVTAEEEDVETSIPEQDNGTTSGDKQERLNVNENNHPRVVTEQNVTPKTLSPEQNCGSILAIDDCKQKEMEIELEKMNSEEKTAEPTIGQQKYGMDVIENAPQRQTNNDSLTYVNGAHSSNGYVNMYALPLEEEEDVDSSWDFEHSGEVKDPDSERAVEKGVHTSKPGLHLETTSEEEQESPDGSKNNHPCFVPEQSVTQKTLSLQQNAGWLQSAILTTDLCKQKKREKDLKEMKSKIFLPSHLGKRNIRQRQSPKDDIGHMYQSDTYDRHLKSLEESISHLEGQNKLLQQQLDDTHTKSDLTVQEQLKDIRKILLTIAENKNHILENKNKELMKEFNDIKAKTKVVVRQLQQEVDTLKKQAMSQKLEVPSPYYVTLQAEIQDLKKTLQEHRNLITDLAYKRKTASPEHAHLKDKKESHEQELLSLREILNKCEELKNEKEMWKQEYLNLKSYIAMNMVTKSEIEKDKRELEERIGHYLEEIYLTFYKLLQQQDTSHYKLEQLRFNNITLIKSQMERKIKDLESQLSQVKTSQESARIKLEKYTHLYKQELKKRTSLQNQLNEMEESLAETRAQLTREQQRAARSTAPARPVLEPPRAGSLGSPSPLRRDPAPRDVRIPTSAPQRRASGESVDAFVARMEKELEAKIAREVRAAWRDDPEMEVTSCEDLMRLSPDEQDLLAREEYAKYLTPY